MTFFANSGVAWPKLQFETQNAGSASLRAASRLWSLFSVLESGDRGALQSIDIAGCARELNDASAIYHKIAADLRHVEAEPLTPAEIEVAALPHLPYSSYDAPWLLFPLLNGRRSIDIGALYLELAQRSETLSAAVRTLPFERDELDLAPWVFDMMRQWEFLSVLGRALAVLNRRPPTSE